ncbi:lytic transglycosylase Slt [Cocleimonas flava]|uniref:Soluble lytic murein transglycosylase n=1 Tax=Cocleimonas flava TaxID=634765 RepID=A0A4V2P7R4_9GAMM|nr:transglycosylase SLT domain-containing protein [Cocleimonas flava]TCJ82815.1 soluble lytic murein transglycosylase [Cocleimonas flava]
MKSALKIIYKSLLGIVFLLFLSHNSFAYTNQKQVNDFHEAYDKLHKGQLYDSSHLKGYILHPYLDYERLKQNIKTSNNQSLLNFIHQNPPSWLSDDINTELLIKLSQQQQWGQILKFYKKGQGGIKARCVNAEASMHIRPSAAINNEALKIWLSANSRPKVCDPLFALLVRKGLVNDSRAWQRITLAMDKGKTGLARALSKYLNEPSLVNLWINLRKHPLKNLKNKRLKNKDGRSTQLIAYGIKRLARKNTETARSQWNKFQRSHTFSTKLKADVESYIGVREALNHNPYALQKLAAIPATLRSEEATIWTARMALRQGDWRKLRSAIDSMPAETKTKDRWRYWRAQTGKRLGEKNTHQQLLPVANNASFYGFLAADELRRPYSAQIKPTRNWSQLTPRIANMPSMQRATELYAIGKPKLAKKEWFWTLKKLNKQDKLTAAAYALEINQPFLAIITVSQTKDWNQTGLRFPMEYQSLVSNSARKHGIIPAWVYGIMRRESAFDPQIVSSANAKGLMQILPATAKNVARKLGIRSHRTSDLFVPEKNANLGAAYLSQMLKRFKGNYVKATASYNAGPGRIPRWTPDKHISAPRWIESIPFEETRNYVRAVMSYTTIYDYKLHARNNANQRLSKRLQAVGPN